MKELREEKNVERIENNKINALWFDATYQEANESQDGAKTMGEGNLPLMPIISQCPILNTYRTLTLIFINKVSDRSI
ncbi:hypothetical protein CN600_29500 [Bacillus mycoides]|nr:hypothetical protein CN600_29500 [Bacillus mycoides]